MAEIEEPTVELVDQKGNIQKCLLSKVHWAVGVLGYSIKDGDAYRHAQAVARLEVPPGTIVSPDSASNIEAMSSGDEDEAVDEDVDVNDEGEIVRGRKKRVVSARMHRGV